MDNNYHIKITRNDEIVADDDVDCFIGSFHKVGKDEGQDVCIAESADFLTILNTYLRTKKISDKFLNEAIKGGNDE